MAALHGTNTRYVQGCKCDDCKEAHREYAKDYARRNPSIMSKARAATQRRLQERVLAGDPTVTHGKVSTYVNGGCRCDECSEANAERHRRYRANREAS